MGAICFFVYNGPVRNQYSDEGSCADIDNEPHAPPIIAEEMVAVGIFSSKIMTNKVMIRSFVGRNLPYFF